MGMILLPKKEIDRQKQVERQQEIEQGKTLAKKVDALRETLADEEQSLTNYRNRTIQAIQREVDAHIAEKDALGADIRDRKLELARLMQPLDAKWAEVNEKQALVSKREDKCTEREVKIDRDKQTNLFTAQQNDKKARDLGDWEETISRHATENGKIREEADRILVANKSKAAQKEQMWAKRDKELDEREGKLDALAASLQRFQVRLTEKEADIVRREYEALALKLQYESPVKYNGQPTRH